jgi:hypothetical protein
MSESESAVLIEQLRRAKGRWKAAAVGLSFVLAIFLVGTGYAVIQMKLATE